MGTSFGSGFRCSRKSCGQIRAAERALNPKPVALVKQMPEEEQEIQKRFKLAQLPVGLTGDAAQQWSKDKLSDMLPEAVAQLQWDLRKGSDKVRSETADKVIRANGMDKREAVNSDARPAIIVNITGGSVSAPWLERLQPKKKDGDK